MCGKTMNPAESLSHFSTLQVAENITFQLLKGKFKRTSKSSVTPRRAKKKWNCY
jgi:hypothetical protein